MFSALEGADGVRSRTTNNASNTFDTFTYDPQGNLVGTNLSNEFNINAAGLTTSLFDPYGDTLGIYNCSTGSAGSLKSPFAFGAQYGYYTDWDLTASSSSLPNVPILLGARYYDPGFGRFLNRDPIGYKGGQNLYNAFGGNPVNEIDPSGESVYIDPVATIGNFFSGAASSLTFGATDRIHEWMGTTEYVNENSGAYNAGVWTEIGVETVASGGSALLKHAAERAIAKQVAKGLTRSEAQKVIRAAGARYLPRDSGIAHHANPLFGHPGGRVPTVFPTGGLAPRIANAGWNIERYSSVAAHVARHSWIKVLDRSAPYVFNRYLTTVRAGRDIYDSAKQRR